jgi:hypothetical protein
MGINRSITCICLILILQLNIFPQNGFNHRGYLGWLIDLSRTDCLDEWPSIRLDSSLIGDYEETLEFLQRSHMTEISLWGFFTNKFWEPEVEKTIDEERETMVKKLLIMAHERKIKVLCGLGIYSWGFNKIIQENPNVGCACNNEIMDISSGDSWKWQKKVIDYITDHFEFDGMSLQSADLGRCSCGKSKKYSDMEYHALLNQMAVKYIRSRKPDYIIGISGWGMNFSKPSDLKYVKQMTRGVDFLTDVGETAQFMNRDYRKELIRAIAPCEYGNTAIPNIEPIQALPRYYYFVPTVFRTGQRIKELYSDGGRACEAYARTRGNPGDEITIEVVAKLLNNPGREISDALEETLQQVFQPENEKVLSELVHIYHDAENAFFNDVFVENREDQYNDIILLMPRNQKVPESTYLKGLSDTGFNAYKTAMQNIQSRILSISGHVGNQDKMKQLDKCIATIMREINKTDIH